MSNEHKPLISAKSLIPTGEVTPVDIEILPHQGLCLIGPDSSRLTHYLRALAAAEPPEAGKLTLLGRPLESMNKRQWREQRQQMGFVAKGAPLLSVLPGLENVMLPALYHNRMTRQEARARAIELLEENRCECDYSKLPAHLTQQQRLHLAIARATILEPKVLFVDEPFSGLSLTEQRPVFEYLVESRRKRALVVATHNLHLVKELAMQVLFLGKSSVLYFANWSSLASSQESEVAHYLELYHHHYRAI